MTSRPSQFQRAVMALRLLLSFGHSLVSIVPPTHVGSALIVDSRGENALFVSRNTCQTCHGVIPHNWLTLQRFDLFDRGTISQIISLSLSPQIYIVVKKYKHPNLQLIGTHNPNHLNVLVQATPLNLFLSIWYVTSHFHLLFTLRYCALFLHFASCVSVQIYRKSSVILRNWSCNCVRVAGYAPDTRTKRSIRSTWHATGTYQPTNLSPLSLRYYHHTMSTPQFWLASTTSSFRLWHKDSSWRIVLVYPRPLQLFFL